MSQLLSRLSNLSSRNHSLMHKIIRLFSSSSTSPYCIIEKPLPGGGNIGDVVLFDPAKEELLSVLDKKIPKELLNADVIGASHGWGFYSDKQDRSLCISDYFNPLATKPNPATIPLPMLTALYSCQTENVWNVAMSSSPDQEDEDLVVGIKFLGTQLSLCRPRRDLRWTNISTPFESFQKSNLMYSKRDQTFNLPTPGGNYLCVWDLQFHKDDYPKFHELLFHNLPELPQSKWELLYSCLREDHWVESPSGESFLVKWYSSVSPDCSTLPIFMVFKEEDIEEGRRNMCYTEDIRDMCIFLSKNEAFCVKASFCPGLKSNSIYFMGRGFAVYDLSTKTSHHFEHPNGAPIETPFLPYWLPPFSLYFLWLLCLVQALFHF